MLINFKIAIILAFESAITLTAESAIVASQFGLTKVRSLRCHLVD
jgi:hypothetical protein